MSSRVVVAGSWSADGVVRMGQWHHTGALAQVRDDKEETLTWSFAVSRGPRTLASLHERIDELMLGGLLDLTAHLAVQDVGSPERREFAESWRKLDEDGCRIVEAVEGDGRLVPVRKICSQVP